MQQEYERTVTRLEQILDRRRDKYGQQTGADIASQLHRFA